MKLTKSARDQLTDTQFLGPNRTFPGNDKTHLQKAIQLAPRSLHAGNITKGEEQTIVRKAKRKLKAMK